MRIPSESPGPVHRAVQRRLVPADGIFLWLLGHMRRIVQPVGTSSHSVPEVCRSRGMYEPLVLIVMGFGTHRVTHRARCWSKKIGSTHKEVESYRRAVGQFAIHWCALQWQPRVWLHWTCVHSWWFAAECRNFIFFPASPPKGGMWSSRWTSAIHL